MRRGAWLVFAAVVVAVLSVGSARAAASGTTTSGTTTGTTTAPSYADVPQSFLPRGCVGAGAAALVVPAHPVVAFGTPASSLGPSAYAPAGTVLSFASSSSSGSACQSGGVTLSSVSLFDGAVTADSVQATGGNGTVGGLEVDGSAVAASPGQTLSVGGWGQLTLGATVGRVRAPLVVRLLQAHDSLPAGTVVAMAFAASAAQPVARSTPKHRSQARHEQKHVLAPRTSLVPMHSARKHLAKKERRRQPLRQPPDYPSSSDPLLAGGALAPVVEHNPVVSLAVQYLGIPYEWAGANPKAGFDCSGLVKYVFAQLGVTLPHYAAAQWSSPDAVPVPPDKLQPGDLVFFTGSDGTRKAPGHVGIYLGDGYLIDAPHTGAFVQVDSFNEAWFANKYVGARRIVGPSPGHSRHLLHATQNVSFVPSLPLAGLPQIAVDRTAAHTYSPRADQLWTSVGLVAFLLLVSFGAVAGLRRRRS
ncbi:MAG TPA: C40 family peptidase [Gaiellaceae bacterium]|nr:C40 family peptidase [Gaiellaceae bacterium]